MSKVTGYFSIIKDGVLQNYQFTDLDYGKFWVAQKGVIDLLNALSLVGVSPLLGVETELVGNDTSGNVMYRYLVDFEGGGSSDGENSWEGISSTAAAWIAAELEKAVAPLKQ